MDTRQFPIRPDRPHIFRVRGEWRVFVERRPFYLDDEYERRVLAALFHIHPHRPIVRGTNNVEA